jgi:hypothetical protein
VKGARSPQAVQRQRSRIRAGTVRPGALILFCCLAMACGKKGPPLPPLVKLPVAPADLTVARRADTVDLQFTVPNANTDDSRPANVARVDVYAFTGPASVSNNEVLKQGTRVASIAVKAPRDPEATFDPGDPEQSEADVEPPEGAGLEQGAVARIQERLPEVTSNDATPSVRTYLGVSITTRGRQASLSRRAAVPLVPPPPPPAAVQAMYSEKAVTVSWPPIAADPPAVIGYNVYEVAEPTPALLTPKPLTEPQYADTRMTWGAMRCYRVRSVETVGALAVESDISPQACVTLTDRFAPLAPTGLRAVATEGIINLIWDANTEADLDGYILLRGPAPGDELIPITPAVLHDTAFQDPVPPGQRYVYAVQAVDRSGNLSPFSARTEETAR